MFLRNNQLGAFSLENLLCDLFHGWVEFFVVKLGGFLAISFLAREFQVETAFLSIDSLSHILVSHEKFPYKVESFS